MTVPHPIPYQGSKRNLAKFILPFFPTQFDRLIEPFCGSAAVSLAALHAEKIKHVLMGDADEALILLWKAIAETPETFIENYTTLWTQQLGQERAYYNTIRQQFNQHHRAEYFLFLLVRCVKAAVRYNANGEFNQSPDNRRKGTKPATMKKNILGTSTLLQGRADIRHADYRILLKEATPYDLIYLDPPYQGVCKKRDPRYKEKVTFDTFVDALCDLNTRGIPFIVSYDGRTDQKTYGEFLPASLELKRIELAAGRSSQATLLGRNDKTYESLYLSPALIAAGNTSIMETVQPFLFEIPA